MMISTSFSRVEPGFGHQHHREDVPRGGADILQSPRGGQRDSAMVSMPLSARTTKLEP